jgi:hypothetical protein
MPSEADEPVEVPRIAHPMQAREAVAEPGLNQPAIGAKSQDPSAIGATHLRPGLPPCEDVRRDPLMECGSEQLRLAGWPAQESGRQGQQERRRRGVRLGQRQPAGLEGPDLPVRGLQAAHELVPLDLDAVEAVRAGFVALASRPVVMPPVLRLDIAEANGEVDVKTAYVPGLDSFAIKVSPGFFDNPRLGLPSLKPPGRRPR